MDEIPKAMQGMTKAEYDRMAERNALTRQFKMRAIAAGACNCEACGWSSPRLSDDPFAIGSAIEVHHILPVRLGGQHTDDNLALLCPNHHAIADAINWMWRGPRRSFTVTRERLLTVLRLVDLHPESWFEVFDRIEGRPDPTLLVAASLAGSFTGEEIGGKTIEEPLATPCSSPPPDAAATTGAPDDFGAPPQTSGVPTLANSHYQESGRWRP